MRTGEAQIKAAFAEWSKQWRANPSQYADMADAMDSENPVEYGEAAGNHFIKILDELKKKGGE